MKDFKTLIKGISHVNTIQDFVFNAMITFFSFILGYFRIICINNADLFIAIAIVVIVDWIFGIALALKNHNFETHKAMRIIYYLASYWLILTVVLAIEKGYPSAFWMSEAIIMPILTFQVISMIKNLILLGIITNSLAKEIFKNIDRYKEETLKKLDNEAEQ